MLSAAEAEAILAPIVGACTVSGVRQRHGGVTSAAFEVAFDARPYDAVVKVYGQERAGWAPAKEAYIYGLVAGLGLPFPRVLAVGEHLVLTRLPGRLLSDVSAELSDDEVRTVYRELASIMRRLHAVTFESFGYLTTHVLDPQPTNRAYMESRFAAKLRDFVDHGGDTTLAGDVRSFMQRRASAFDVCSTPSLCHNDLHAANILIEDGRISGLVDVENAVAADPLLDVASSLYSIGGDRIETNRAGLREGYGDLGPHGEDRLALYRLSHMLELWDWYAHLGETAHLAPIAADIAVQVGVGA